MTWALWVAVALLALGTVTQFIEGALENKTSYAIAGITQGAITVLAILELIHL